MKYTDLCEHLERMARRDRDGATQAIPRLAKRLHEANAERLEQAAAAIRELEAERDKYEALALLNLQEITTHISRAEAADLRRQLAEARALLAASIRVIERQRGEMLIAPEDFDNLPAEGETGVNDND